LLAGDARAAKIIRSRGFKAIEKRVNGIRSALRRSSLPSCREWDLDSGNGGSVCRSGIQIA
jgi:hypothetical protein